MEDVRNALLTLQDLDEEIATAEQHLAEFEPRLQTLEQPVTQLETEIESLGTRLEQLRQQARRLEHGAEQKRDRLRAYEDRLKRVRNAREEAAARTEMDLVRRATEADETEALEAMEQATRSDLKLDELGKQLDRMRDEIRPQRETLVQERDEAASALEILRDRRANHTIRLDRASLRLYERVRSGRASVVLAPMTSEGACGHCFNVLPIQEQVEVRRGDTLHRCEACGVILYASD